MWLLVVFGGCGSPAANPDDCVYAPECPGTSPCDYGTPESDSGTVPCAAGDVQVICRWNIGFEGNGESVCADPEALDAIRRKCDSLDGCSFSAFSDDAWWLECGSATCG